MRCLVTGITGFVGRHLADALAVAGHEVFGLARAGGTRDGSLRFPLYSHDLCDTAATEAALREIRPEWLFHLAGYADAGKSHSEPAAAWEGNLTATQFLYDAVRTAGVQARILYVSSGLVYGDAGPGDRGLAEEAPLRPASPYAASKAAADLLSYQQTCKPNLDIVRVRPFNQIGPGQSADYAAANFARQIVAIERGLQSHLEVRGNLNAYRDLTDVRDMVRSYIRLLEVGRKGEVYNAGSGQAYLMREVLDRLLAHARVSVRIDEKADPMRSNDTAISRADTRKLREATGWQPAYSLAQTLADMLADWRGR